MSRRTRWLLTGTVLLVAVLVILGIAAEAAVTFALVLFLVMLPVFLYPCRVFGRLLWQVLRRQPRRPLITRREVIFGTLSVVCVLLIVAIAVPLYSINPGARNKSQKAHADTRALASAISMYFAHTGRLPDTLGDLTLRVTNAKGDQDGPFIAAVPFPPVGWSPYRYERRPDGKFSVQSRGPEGQARIEWRSP